jgi:hypothetical protein
MVLPLMEIRYVIERRANQRLTFHATCSGSWDWNVWMAFADAEVLTRVADAPHTEYLIDYTAIRLHRLPNLGTLRHLSKYEPALRTLAVFIAPQHAIKTMMQVYSTLYPEIGRRYRVVDTLEQARALIAEFDRTLAASSSRSP